MQIKDLVQNLTVLMSNKLNPYRDNEDELLRYKTTDLEFKRFDNLLKTSLQILHHSEEKLEKILRNL
jgi:hypothetical protein